MPPARRSRVLTLATTITLATAFGSAARAQAAPGGAPAASASSLTDFPLGTRVRLRTVGLPAVGGGGGLASGGGIADRSTSRTLVGALARIDSTPQLTFVVETAQGTWAVPRSAVTAASRHAGVASTTAGVRRSALTGALIGTAGAVLYAQALGGTDKEYGRRVPIGAGAGAGLALLFWRRAARDEWVGVALPATPQP